MKILPRSTITLYKDVDIGTELQLAFSTKAKQTAYFASKVKKSYVNCTVVKDKIGVVKVAVKPIGQAGQGEITGADLAECNYMSFVNPDFDDKVIYCYLIDYEYDNNETAFIYYTIDYWQTWGFDVTFHNSFIDREHLSVDDWNKVEANPYRPDVPQMVTQEPLPVPIGYEKPKYSIKWYGVDPTVAGSTGLTSYGSIDKKDGYAMLSRLDYSEQPETSAASKASAAIEGSWAYWKVMLIVAPTDWDSFGAGVKDRLDDIITTYSILVSEAGSDILTIPNQINPSNPDQDKTWSCKPRGCDIMIVSNSAAWKELAEFFATYNAVSQIIAIYGIPAEFAHLGTLPSASSYRWLRTDDYTEEGRTYKASNIWDTNVSALRVAGATGMTGGDDGVQKSVTNKKLLTSPFSYMRIISPDGNLKEYQYENFTEVAGATSAATTPRVRFRIVATLDGDAPKVYLAPVRYKEVEDIPIGIKTGINTTIGQTGVGNAFEQSMNVNLDEAICVEGFPQISFNTDGYLTFLGQEYASTRANFTKEAALDLDIERYNNSYGRHFVSGISDVIASTLGGTAKGGSGGGYASGGTAAVGMIQDLMSLSYNRQVTENKAQKFRESTDWANGLLISTDDPDIERFNMVKPAYANSIYRGGTGGVIKYLRGMKLFDFILIHVQLRPEILEYYDKWFDMYGYASGRCGIPHVVSFMHPETNPTDADLPHWATVNGDPTTYIKTHDCRVEHAMMPVAQNIAQMFNKGVRFKKGDLS